MPNPYNPTDEEVARSYRRIHANSEQTHIAILSAGDSAYVAVAYDVDPVEFRPVAAECIAYDPTIDGVAQKADRWMETHPRGVADDDDTGGASRLWGILQKLNDYGTRLVENQPQHQEAEK